jgi:hypothetical protein
MGLISTFSREFVLMMLPMMENGCRERVYWILDRSERTQHLLSQVYSPSLKRSASEAPIRINTENIGKMSSILPLNGIWAL